MKSRSRTSIAGAGLRRSGLLALGICAVLLTAAPVPASDFLKVSVDPDGDQVFEKIREYQVSSDEAIRAFFEAGGAPWNGTGEVITFFQDTLPPGVSFTELQSFDGYLAFLDQRYANRMASRTNQDCDNTIVVTHSPPSCTLSCNPITTCNNNVVVTIFGFDCVAGCDPVCPAQKPGCVKTGVQPTYTGVTGGPHCGCVPNNVTGTCTPTGNPITGFTHTGNVCDCARPALPGWAGIALAGLLFVAGIFVFRNRRREPAT